MKKFISLALALIMVVGIAPATALAVQMYPYGTQMHFRYKDGAFIDADDGDPADEFTLYWTGSDNNYVKIVINDVSDSDLEAAIAAAEQLDVAYKCVEIENTDKTIVWNNGHPSADPVGTTYYEAKLFHAYDIKAGRAAPVPKGNPGNPDIPESSTDETSESADSAPTQEIPRYNPYVDVAESDWFCDAVSCITPLGIVRGVGADRFDPNGQLTWAQTIAFVVRTYQKQTGDHVYGSADQTGANWYDVYVDYAKAHGFISSVPANPNAFITRADAAVLFDKALFDRTVVNKLPTDYEYFFDVAKDDPAHDAIYSLASAGIVAGKEAQKFLGRFHGDETLTRAEAATIVARMVNAVKRATIDVWDLVVYGLDKSHPYYEPIMACIRGELINTGNVYYRMPQGYYCPELVDWKHRTFYIAIDPDAIMNRDDCTTAIDRTALGYHPEYRYGGSVYEYTEGLMYYTSTFPDGTKKKYIEEMQELSVSAMEGSFEFITRYFSQPVDSKIGLPKLLDSGQVTMAQEYLASTIGVTQSDLAAGRAKENYYNHDLYSYEYALEAAFNRYCEHDSNEYRDSQGEHSGPDKGKVTLAEFCNILSLLDWTTFKTLPGSKVDVNGHFYQFCASSGLFGDGYEIVIRDANGNPAPVVWDWKVECGRLFRYPYFRTTEI